MPVLPYGIPEHLDYSDTDFPREDWLGVEFPDIWGGGPYPYAEKVAWAARAASKRWLTAFETKDLSGVDNFDFILAVYDRAHQWLVHP
jgi:hypothetical protein